MYTAYLPQGRLHRPHSRPEGASIQLCPLVQPGPRGFEPGIRRHITGMRTPVEAVVHIDEVMTFETRTGTTRFVLRDTNGNEYTTCVTVKHV
jgi:hypothetical protein